MSAAGWLWTWGSKVWPEGAAQGAITKPTHSSHPLCKLVKNHQMAPARIS